MEKYSVAILGLGNIGMLYDYEDSENFLSHTKSFYNHPNFNITYLIDKDKEKLQLAQHKYRGDIKFIESIKEIKEMPDVFVLASIPTVNLSTFKLLKDNSTIKLFLIEKPFWSSDMIFNEYLKYSDKCVINYPRKFLPFFQELRKGIEYFEYGKALGVHIWYSKGARNNGSHLIDLMNYFFGNNIEMHKINVFNQVIDYSKDDPTYSFSIIYKHKNTSFPVVFLAANETKFSLIEIDLVFEKNRFRIYDFGEKVEAYRIENDPVYKGYKNLISKEVISTNMNTYGLRSVCNEVFDIIHNKKSNISNLENEYNIFNIIDHLKNQSK